MVYHTWKLMRLESWGLVHMGGCHGNKQDELGQIGQTTATRSCKDIVTSDPLR